MRVSMKLGILHFAEVNLTMPWSESPVSQSAERAGWEYGRTQQKNK